jgi:hypothetical protein
MRHAHGPRRIAGGALLLCSLFAGACDDNGPLSSLAPDSPSLGTSATPPASLVTLSAGGGSLSLWPYTGADFSGEPQDPINLVFTGNADPRAIRSALFSLSPDRTGTGFPNVAPFNCTWGDAIGDLQTAYSDGGGWAGSAVQLACGDFGPVRFHLRLFAAGGVTLGAGHFELLIPGTTDHQVLSWELAEQLITADMARSGLLTAAPASTGPINVAPGFRQISPVIYNLLPTELKAVIGGPSGSVSDPVDIGTDGMATKFELGGPAPSAGGTDQHFIVDFNQVIPRPFCATGPTDYLLVRGPVELHKSVRVNGAGALTSEFRASGRLQLLPVDPTTGTPSGDPYEADVKELQVTRYDDSGGQVTGEAMQMELPQDTPGRGKKVVRIKLGAGGVTMFDRDITCKR